MMSTNNISQEDPPARVIAFVHSTQDSLQWLWNSCYIGRFLPCLLAAFPFNLWLYCLCCMQPLNRTHV